MNTTTTAKATSNGQPQGLHYDGPPVSPANCLAMRGGNDQFPGRGAFNSCSLRLIALGTTCALLTIWGWMLEVLRKREQPVVRALDDLHTPTLHAKANTLTMAFPEFTETPTDPHQAHEQYRMLKGLQAKDPTEHHRKLDAAIDDVLNPVIHSVRLGIESAVGNAPLSIPPVIDDVRQRLNNLVIPETDTEPIKRLARIDRALVSLSQPSQSLPKRSKAYLTEQSLKAFASARDEAIATIVHERVTTKLRAGRDALFPFLDELQQSFADVSRSLDAIPDALRKKQSRTQIASVDHPLPGPSEDAVIANLRSTQNANDRHELANALWPKLERQLRAVTKEGRYAHLASSTTPLATLLRLDPSDIADALERVVHDAHGEGASFYEVLQQAGIEHFVDVFRSAHPLALLSGRNSPDLGLEVAQHAIVRHPPANNPADQAVLQEIKELSVDLGTCTFSEAPPTEPPALVVTRVLRGFPIVVEQLNLPYLLHYKRSVGKHRPHLFGVPGSQFGLHRPEDLQLASDLGL